jgi:RNA polymerase sigma factor (TIGR02999 family)
LDSHGEVTRLLADLNAGRQDAENELVDLLYNELHSLAQGYMRRERAGHTLQTTALVNEAYLHLGDVKNQDWEDRAHFFRIAARAMRRVLIDHARRKGAAKRVGHWQRESLEKAAVFDAQPVASLLDLDKALDSLSGLNPKMGQVVELRYFGGLSVEDAARVMEVTPRTVARYWRMAKAWLVKEIEQDNKAP